MLSFKYLKIPSTFEFMAYVKTVDQRLRFGDTNPGRLVQQAGTANFLGEDPKKIGGPVWAVTGSEGDSQCYTGVKEKVEAIQEALAARIRQDDMWVRLIPPYYAPGISDGQLNGTERMRYSLIGREVSHDAICLHLSGSQVEGHIAVVACDKPPVGTLAAILEHNRPAIVMSDGSIRPGADPETGERIDIVSAFQVAGDSDKAKKDRYTFHACPGIGSCGGMFTYNTMQSFFGAIGMEPLHMVAPASDDERRVKQFPNELINYLLTMTKMGIKPSDIVTSAAIRNGLTVAVAMGGSTNVMLHSVEIARAAGIDIWNEVITQDEFNSLSKRIPVLVNARPFGYYSMVDIESSGGLQAVVNELLKEGLLDGSCITCTGETLHEQVRRLNPPDADHKVVYSVGQPFKETGGLRLLSGSLAPEGGAIIKIAGVEGGLEKGVFTGRARVFNGEQKLIEALEKTPEVFADKDMVVIRYEGPRGAPGMPELLDPTSRITSLCREKGITIALMTDARFSGGSVGLVIGHVSPEAYLGGPIALVEDGDTIVVDLNRNRLDCIELQNGITHARRREEWEQAAVANGGVHPEVKHVENRLLQRMRRTASPALQGAGMHD